jgi:hypothetical protein
MTPRDGKSGRFLPGVSGNPAGSKKWTPAERRAQARRLRAAELRAEAQANVQSIFQRAVINVSNAMIRAAEGGDPAAGRLVLERVDPPRRPESPPAVIEGFDQDIETAAASVQSAVARGAISVEKGEALMAILEEIKIEN